MCIRDRVYTQLTDVEDEVNGLFTYDRAALKPEAAAAVSYTHLKKAPMPGDAAALEAFVNTADCTRSNGYMTTRCV